MRRSPTEVALLALIYDRLSRDRYSGAESLMDDLEGFPGGVSLGGMIASQMFERLDWLVIALMNTPEPADVLVPLVCARLTTFLRLLAALDVPPAVLLDGLT